MHAENVQKLEEIVQRLLIEEADDPVNIIGVALTIYDESHSNQQLKTLLRNMTSAEINAAFLGALLPY
ncbi:hypothetical protein [Lapidilactobacillus luobeiensis]|uniref:hypothetical protein n=1 Tax=Lapidilactobacillus luobeiensis TaxID=2950371 RepID=UPI0021C29ADC|nr:hypothetical protein [Lapidilactobacillus luobeiensis]